MELIAVSRLPTKWGLFQAYCYQSKLDGTEHIAVVKVMRFSSVTCRSSRMLRFFFLARSRKLRLDIQQMICSDLIYIFFCNG